MNRPAICRWFLCVLFAAAPPARSADDPDDWEQVGDEFRVDTVQPQTGWVIEETVPPGKWKPIEQPDLAAQLEAAPELKFVDVAPAPQRCWMGRRPYLVPNPDGRSWDMVYPYYNKYRGVQEVILHDFGSGRTSRQLLSTGQRDSVLTREPIGFHMQPSYYADGKLVFEMYGAVKFVIYDPAVDRFTAGVKPFGDEVINGRCALGGDGIIYGMGWPKDKSGFVAYSFDPKTLEAKRFDTFGPANKHRRELYRRVQLSGDWIYAAVGAQPWHLVAFNFETGEGRLLATTEQIIGDYKTIGFNPVEDGLKGYIRSAASIRGVDEFDREEFPFWLHDGNLFPRTGDVPPWSDEPAKEVRPPRFKWQRESQHWPRGFEPPSPPPMIEGNSADPDAEGRCRMRYQPGGQEEWKTLEYQVQMYPGIVRLLREVNGQVLFATDEGYGQHAFYDLKSKKLRRIGGTLSPYSIGFCRSRLYVSGYPGSQLIEYDFDLPLGLRHEKPNPKRLGAPPSDTHIPLGGTVAGADGRVYNCGTTAGRRRIGGGMGWFDTNTRQLGGIAIDGHRMFWMTAVDDGRYVVLSSKSPEQGKLFVWDTESHEFRHRLDPPGGATRPGPIVEALKGLVIGHTVDAGEQPILYGFHPAAGKILWTRPVPSPPITAFSQVRRQAYSFRRGPNGYVWAFFGDTLVRIDPRNTTVKPVGKTKPAQLAFAAGKIYIAGGPALRRVEGVEP